MDLDSLANRRGFGTILLGSALAGLLGATACAVASVSGWLVPVYLLVVVVILAAPRGPRISPPASGPMSGLGKLLADRDGTPSAHSIARFLRAGLIAGRGRRPSPAPKQGGGARRASDADGPSATAGEAEPRLDAVDDPGALAAGGDDAGPGTLRVDPAATAIPKPRKSRARSRKTAKPTIEPVADSAPVSWVRVGPGQYVRSDTIPQGQTPVEASPPSEVPPSVEAPAPAEAPPPVEAQALIENQPPVEAQALAEVPSLSEASAPVEDTPAVEAQEAPAEATPAVETPVLAQDTAPVEAHAPAEVPPEEGAPALSEAPSPVEATPPTEDRPAVEDISSTEATTPAEAMPAAEVPSIATHEDPLADHVEPATVEPAALIEADPVADVPEADAPAPEEPAVVAHPFPDAPVVVNLPAAESEATELDPTAAAPETEPAAPEVLPEIEPVAEEYGIAPSALGPAETTEVLPVAPGPLSSDSGSRAEFEACRETPDSGETAADPEDSLSDQWTADDGRRGNRLVPPCLINRSPAREPHTMPSRRVVRGPVQPRAGLRGPTPRDPRRDGVARRAPRQPNHPRHAWRARSPPCSP
jgi:hypothetical protein